MWKKRQFKIWERWSPEILCQQTNSAKTLKIKSIFWFCISPVQVSGQFQGMFSAILWIFFLSFSSFIFGRKYSPSFISLGSLFLSWPLFSSLQRYLYICLFLLSSSCNSDGICDTVGEEEETCWPLLWWSRRNGQMIRELPNGRGKAMMSLTSTPAFPLFCCSRVITRVTPRVKTTSWWCHQGIILASLCSPCSAASGHWELLPFICPMR